MDFASWPGVPHRERVPSSLRSANGAAAATIIRFVALPKLEPGPKAGDRAFNAIHAAIISGELTVGQRLRIRDLAEELGTSTMPVREAIGRLTEMGLAESLPYRGAVVKGFTHSELLNLYAVRSVLEAEATLRGIPALSDAAVDGMADEVAGMKRSLAENDVLGYLDHDEQFLLAIYEAGGNDVLVEMIRTLWHRCQSFKIIGVQHELEADNLQVLLQYQERLLDAARDRDGDRAREATADSLEAATERIRQGLPATTSRL